MFLMFVSLLGRMFLQEEMQRQQEEDELAAIAVEKRKRMIEYERESIEKKPFMDIQKETKKFRQDIFKRRYKARVLENQCRTLPLFQCIEHQIVKGASEKM